MKKSITSLVKLEEFSRFQKALIDGLDSLVDEFLEERIRHADEQFMVDGYALVREYCRRPGKRIRPLLVMLSYMGYGGKKRRIPDVMKVGGSVELMHAFLLIQDDIIDRADTRRGGAALHVETQKDFTGITTSSTAASDVALILGDVVMACAMELAGSVSFGKKVMREFWKVFAYTYEMTAWGQVRDIMYSMPSTLQIEEDVPRQISRLKTAHYTIRSPLHTGYVLSGGNIQGELQRINEFGMNLGMAFQVRDDIIGVFGRQDETGKPTDSDIMEGKFTLLIHHAYQLLDENRRQHFEKLFCSEKKTAADVDELRAMINSSGAHQRAKDELSSYIGNATDSLGKLSITAKYRGFLQEIVEMVSRC